MIELATRENTGRVSAGALLVLRRLTGANIDRLIQDRSEEELVPLYLEVGRRFNVFYMSLELSLAKLKKPFLVAPVEGKKGDLSLIAHAAARWHENLHLLILSKPDCFCR